MAKAQYLKVLYEVSYVVLYKVLYEVSQMFCFTAQYIQKKKIEVLGKLELSHFSKTKAPWWCDYSRRCFRMEGALTLIF